VATGSPSKFVRTIGCAVTALLLSYATANAQGVSPLPPGPASGAQDATIGTGAVALGAGVIVAGIPALLGTKNITINATTVTGAENEIDSLLEKGNGRIVSNGSPLPPGGAAGSAAVSAANAALEDYYSDYGSGFVVFMSAAGSLTLVSIATSTTSSTSTTGTH